MKIQNVKLRQNLKCSITSKKYAAKILLTLKSSKMVVYDTENQLL